MPGPHLLGSPEVRFESIIQSLYSLWILKKRVQITQMNGIKDSNEIVGFYVDITMCSVDSVRTRPPFPNRHR